MSLTEIDDHGNPVGGIGKPVPRTVADAYLELPTDPIIEYLTDDSLPKMY